ncbi:putative transcription factor interactor and regulator LisH family [Helianthus annuus]|uniref:Putative LIS1 homology motif, SRP40 n=1 Tax=Helianthus annuus TaxID=4232 RepID=A0A251V5Y2_HELAN|nr:nucleolar and coiled-body phosphoprotein 1 [Helianthus annuus]KAF5813331.1 putative transcription factor interactor and regulator LisH family [Helianthus annuus]KAJ0599525.1 putative transcription factor interactor and regulator LisH family [Helianthus annuus]KAJ0607079.1 putative transcription factor interactor and regulator LisH family [Helianthus annuus]KAJ0772985.1 putative transcription factor interactor and regulator LisH family [Helianthus annuus]KAJ0934499.1 putative transcription f
MLHRNTTTNTPSFGSLLAFKPRQVLLAQHNNPPTPTTSMDQTELKGNLHELILDYLHRNGFSKTLKRFQSEAQIQTDAWKASSLHLEDMFCKHNACNADTNKNTSEKPVLGNDEVTSKKKKKKAIVENDDYAIKDQSEVTGKKIKESSKNVGQISKDITVNEPETQPKKKKTKHDLVSSTGGSKTVDLTKKNKDKMKKDIEKVNLEPSTTNEDELVTAQKEKKKSSTDEKEKKSSKKRKRSSSDENKNENVSAEITISEELKRQKTETSKEKNSRKEEINALETSNEQFDGETNGKLEKDGVKSKKKQRNVTAEPKTVNAFQRVKIDEVEFAHDKLQDNSYWAKGGAEIGYGAKAQEVLGQVRGRDFRHEKTKKKRGSYRGGLIDQQSHSIKFNYSDEE